jgi:SAM-dependent methyltransferase
MQFDKYDKKGAYHWAQYEAGTPYTVHVDRVREWIRPGSVLDVGAGDGVLTYFLDGWGIDNCEKAVELAREKGSNVSLGSAYELEGEWDNVLLSDVLEHLQYPDRALKQIKNVLKEDGLLYIVVPRPRYPGAPPRKYHYQEWTAPDLISFMRSQGWTCLEIELVMELKRIYGIFKPTKNG